MVRKAGLGDLGALVELEASAFHGNRISRQSFRRLLTRGHATTLVDDERGRLRGYVMLLYRRGGRTTRLYSIAVAEDARGRGVARGLLAAGENDARRHGSTRMKVEIREDNTPSIGLFRGAGYEQFATEDDYYDDHARGLFFQKDLRRGALSEAKPHGRPSRPH